MVAMLTCGAVSGARPGRRTSDVVALAAKVAFIATVFAVVILAYLMASPVHSGPVDCGKLADYQTAAYVTKELPIPAELARCEAALQSRSSWIGDLFDSIGMLFVAALAASLLATLLRLAESALAPRLRRHRIGHLGLGNDIKVVMPGDTNVGRIGRIIESLPSSDEFDVVVTFDELPMNVYAYRYREVEPLAARPSALASLSA
jgi:hypothetical protein